MGRQLRRNLPCSTWPGAEDDKDLDNVEMSMERQYEEMCEVIRSRTQ